MSEFIQWIKVYWIACTLVVFITLTVLSLWPLETLPPAPGSDKLHHLLAYAALAFPVVLRRPRLWVFIMIGFVLYSGLIELLQPLVQRYCELFDLAANTIGILCGVFFAELARRRYVEENDRKRKRE